MSAPIPIDLVHHRVVVVGGGLSGLMAALTVEEPDTAVVSRVHPVRSHSGAAQGGVNAALANHPEGKHDTWQKHAYDTVKGSDYLADQPAVEEMCRRAIPTIHRLDGWGCPFSRFPDGTVAQRPFGGGGFPRTCYAADRTGHVMLHTLYEQSVKKGVRSYSDCVVIGLAVSDGRCHGVIVIDTLTGRLRALAADVVLFATGGYGRVYLASTNALINTGSGVGIAYRAGVPIKDLEFVQFHPTCLIGTSILMTEGARGEGGTLLNNRGERFMQRYAPSVMELAPRDIVSRSIFQEVRAGRGFPGDAVHLDLTHLGRERILSRLPGIRDICIHFAGLDPVEKPIPIHPAQHYSMGGIDTDQAARTALPGFYAAGECACVSVHGANRLGGNSLLETVVFGAVAGESITADLPRLGRANTEAVMAEAGRQVDRIRALTSRSGGIKPAEVLNAVRTILHEKVGIYREATELAAAVAAVREQRAAYPRVTVGHPEVRLNQELVNALELEQMIDLAEIIAVGAQMRQESRGSHARTDFPVRDDKRFLAHTLATPGPEGPRVEYRPVAITSFQPEERKY